jgi:membrane-associated phospholipid phosphatase
MSTGQAAKRERLRALHEKFVVELRERTPAQKTRLNLLAIALIFLGVVGFMAILIDVLQRDGVSIIDEPVQRWLADGRAPGLTTLMIGLAILFGPIMLPLIILIVTVAWGIAARHAWRPFLLAVAMLSGVSLALTIGPAVGRSRPPLELMLFGPDLTHSFPSGHVLGASDFLLVGAYLVFSRRSSPGAAAPAFAAAVDGIAAAGASRIYLGYHWATDALASVCLSMVVLGVIIALDTWRTVIVGPTPEGRSASHEALFESDSPPPKEGPDSPARLKP